MQITRSKPFQSLVFLCLLLLSLPVQAQRHPKNIILMIGDGMGLTQISAALIANGHQLNLERIQTIGLSKTRSADNLITDSAAGATAIACGQKTKNGAIALSADDKPIPTILEIAHNAGLSTGIAVTSIIQHATPACFYAHQLRRDLYHDISQDLLTGTVDVAIGGGALFFQAPGSSENVLNQLGESGYALPVTIDEAEKLESSRMLVITDRTHPPSMEKGRGDYLMRASLLAIDKLDPNGKGFFLMIEGSQIDWAGHAVNGEYLLEEMLDFDGVIGAVLDFAEKDGETLVIVTADHETGGLAITDGSPGGLDMKLEYISARHTGTMVPVFAWGPGAEAFAGMYDNTEIFFKMLRALRLDK